MESSCTNLTEAVRSFQQLKIDGYSAIKHLPEIEFKWIVNGYDWAVSFYPAYACRRRHNWVALAFLLLDEPRTSDVTASLRCRLVDPSGNHGPSEERSASRTFSRPHAQDMSQIQEVFLMRTDDLPASGYLVNDSLTVECTITVLKEKVDIVIPAKEEQPLPVPSSDMHQHFSELLQSQTGADVTFTVSGESFAAHKLVLAARSPVFKAEFFGNMEEKSSKHVQIEDMEVAVFKAMLHFIYTDTTPELDEEPEAAATMAQHLLAAADRYGLDRLKLICEAKLSCGIDVDTAATTLALAEQHNCSLLKAKCVDFITASPERLDAVVATEGYKHLVASCPLVLTELLKAARGRKN